MGVKINEPGTEFSTFRCLWLRSYIEKRALQERFFRNGFVVYHLPQIKM